MLPKEENQLLTRTGPGTPMGQLMRCYWLPALLSEEIPSPDCPPVQVRLLGQELVAFRNTEGRVGLLDERCSHRGTSLFYGRNEECGLRCIYHGWKYDVDGNVLDTPAEPYNSTLKDKVHHPAYPTREVAGVVFAYLGPKDKIPLFPKYEWTLLPKDQVYVSKVFQECNYLQGVEGECDSAHLSYLHRAFTKASTTGGDPNLYRQDGAPSVQPVPMDFGLRMISLRDGGDGTGYLRVSNFVMPNQGFVPTGGIKGNKEGYSIHTYVPVDDTHVWRYMISFRRNRAIREDERIYQKEIGPGYRKIRNLQNHFLQDREQQRKETFIGIGTNFMVHDACATESMGPIFDRSRETLGKSDTAVIAMRRYLLKAVKNLQDGKEPPHIVTDPQKNDFRHIVCLAHILEAKTSPEGYIEEYISQGPQAA